MSEKALNMLTTNEGLDTYTGTEVERMEQEYKDSDIADEVSYGLKYDEEACTAFFEAFQQKVDFTTITHPSGLYEVPLFTSDPLNALRAGFELNIRTDTESVSLLTSRGHAYASQYPNNLIVDRTRLTPLHRLETYLVGSREFAALSQEEGLEHELRHLYFQRTVDQMVTFTRALDEAFALTTLGTAAAHTRYLSLAKEVHSLDDIEFGVNMFLALRGLGKDEMTVLNWLNEQNIIDDWENKDMPPEEIKRLLLGHVGLSPQEVLEQARLVRQRARTIKTVFRYQVLQAYRSSRNKIIRDQQLRDVDRERERKYGNWYSEE